MISVVIPAHNSEKTIEKAVEGCLSQAYDKDNLEIVVVDDGSTDKTGEVAKQYPVKYIYQENAGPAAARNTGWKNARGEVVCFTDSDCVPEKDWVSRIVQGFSSMDISGVGGSYSIANPESLLARCVHQEIVERHRKMSGEVDFLGSFNVSYRKKVLEEVGGFNEEFKKASGEDNDLAYRIRKKGYKLIFDKEIKVAHYHQTNFFKYLKEQFQHGFWRMKLYRLHPDMAKGDRYAGILDFIQPPVAMLILAGLLLVTLTLILPLQGGGKSEGVSRGLLPIISGLILLLVLLQFPLAFSVIRREKEISYLFLIPMLFFRAFARGLGMLKGIWFFSR